MGSRKLSQGEVRRPNKATAHVHRAPGGGRPPNPPKDPLDLVVFVEGRARVPSDDAEVFEQIGRLRAAVVPFNLAVQAVEIKGADPATVRREWGSSRVRYVDAEHWLAAHPGVTFLEWAEKVFMAGEPMTAPAFAAARAKAKVALSIMWKAGKIRKEKNDYGQLTLWPTAVKRPKPDAPPADIIVAVESFVDDAISRSKRSGARALSTKALVAEVVDIVWNKRLYYEEKI